MINKICKHGKYIVHRLYYYILVLLYHSTVLLYHSLFYSNIEHPAGEHRTRSHVHCAYYNIVSLNLLY